MVCGVICLMMQLYVVIDMQVELLQVLLCLDMMLFFICQKYELCLVLEELIWWFLVLCFVLCILMVVVVGLWIVDYLFYVLYGYWVLLMIVVIFKLIFSMMCQCNFDWVFGMLIGCVIVVVIL